MRASASAVFASEAWLAAAVRAGSEVLAQAARPTAKAASAQQV
jgi:hypothetical protein